MLGLTVTDKVTGFKGVVVGYVTYLTGCNQGLVQPKAGADGKFTDAVWIDEQRLVAEDAERIVLDNGSTPGFDRPPPVR